ncbi:outer membrane protein [Helicobacter sp. faydin-H20]|uniref:outer membrane beta-barrel protein n=1 Tax=Helicobacter anatolicus TaxID=2905874 RepID=UPI001E4E8E68|nr:outer membrane beta-barrel protein [Helicobacter anatolicus]MCE3037150.1 outer membrane protein [Helicobacter anatolicus]
MKKITISMVFLGLGSIFAESIDEEIERLEKENKLLELKQKQQVLQKDLEQGRITNSNNAIEKPLPKDYTKQKEKNGFFLGVEAELGSMDYLRYTTNSEIPSDTFNYNDTNITFNGGLLLGYQHYFDANAKHGIKVSSHLYSGIGYEINNFIQKIDSNQSKTIETTHSFIPIKFGVDVKYLYDFLNRDNHSLGLNAGLGYEVDYYLENFLTNNAGFSYSNNNILVQGVYFTIGLHYLFKKHHLFEMNYRLGGIFGLINHQNIEQINNENNLKSQIGVYNLHTQSYLTISYAYKF